MKPQDKLRSFFPFNLNSPVQLHHQCVDKLESKPGCAFAGWNTTSAGTGTTYAPGAAFAVGNANVTLYAVWRSEFLYVADSTNATLAEGSYHGKLTFDTSGKFCLSDKDQGAYGLDVFSQDPPTGVLTHIGTEPGEAGLSIAGDILPLFLP